MEERGAERSLARPRKPRSTKCQVDVRGADDGDHPIHLPQHRPFRLLSANDFREDTKMRSMLALTLGLVAVPLAAEPPAVRLDSVSYAELAGELKALKGKVVLVDVWGTFCRRARRSFRRWWRCTTSTAGKGWPWSP